MNDEKRLNELLKRVEKPGRYIGKEINIYEKNIENVKSRFAFAFPDTYEIGMSYTGLQILYNILNKTEDIYCERVFAPANDMEDLMRRENLPLFTLETKTPVKDMDFLGFTLQYEMAFTNILNMLDLAQIPILKEERERGRDKGMKYPIIVAGGPCAYNPEPLADFIDVFLIGDGEELLQEFNRLYIDSMKMGKSKGEFLMEASKLDGVYVPEFYEISYDNDETIKAIASKKLKMSDGSIFEAPQTVKRAIVDDINLVEFPDKPIVPLIEVVHDRSVIETFRGCTRGCRFCQAGIIYRPVRERSKSNLIELAKNQIENTGNDELSLLSLSTSDYSDFEGLALELMGYCQKNNVSLSLPSLRLDSFSFKVLDEIQKYKKSGLTFAVEAGTQRLRDVINKGVNEKDIYDAISKAIDLGWRNVKLYFMIGLPTETYEDLDGIADIAKNIIDIKRSKNAGKLGKFNVTVSVSNFVPKAHTPFQWFGQNAAKEFEEKHNYLAQKLHIKGVTFNYHDNKTSELEAVLARGDRRVGKVIYEAWKLGCKFDGWTEYFKHSLWESAFTNVGVDSSFYTNRDREYSEILPWNQISCGVSKEFLLSEAQKANKAETTNDCRHGCVGCGINQRTKCEMEGYYE